MSGHLFRRARTYFLQIGMHIPSATFLLLIIVLFAGSGLMPNKWLKFAFGSTGIVVLVSGIAGVFG